MYEFTGFQEKKPIVNTHAQIDAYSVFFGAQIRVYFTKLQQVSCDSMLYELV